MRREPQTEHRTAFCERCGGSVEYSVVILGEGGKELPPKPPAFCQACQELQEEEARAREEEARRRRADEEFRSREERIGLLLQEVGVNPRSHGKVGLSEFDGRENPEALQASEEFVEILGKAGAFDYIRGLFLAGPTGVGKTHLGVGITRELLLQGWDPKAVIFERSGKLVAEIQTAYSTGGAMALMKKREDASLWVLDDLGAEKPTPDVVRIFTELLAAREGHPTVITSNLTPRALLDRYAEFERVVSRLGIACFRTVEMKGRDRRYRRPS